MGSIYNAAEDMSVYNRGYDSPASNKSSPPAEGATAYHFNPYDANNCRHAVAAYNDYNEYNEYPSQHGAAYAAAAPTQHFTAEEPARKGPAVLHTQLEGFVTFIPYPTESHPIPEMTVPKENLSRVFLGQLPYRVTHMQLAWLCDTIAPGTALFNIETIMKKTGMKGKRLPTGCVHALTHPEHVDYLIECLSWRVLFDDSGIWFAQSPDEQAHLQSYCAAMKQNEGMRFRDRPYQPVVVQMATSNYGHRHQSTPPRTSLNASMTTPPPSPPMGAAAYGYPQQHAWGPGY